MLSTFRFARIAILFLAVSGSAQAQEAPAPAVPVPAVPAVSIYKVNIQNGSTASVKYYVTGGTPLLEAMVHRLQWAENEVGLVEQLQFLKMDSVAGERQVVPALALKRAGYPPPFTPLSFAGSYGGNPGYGCGESPLVGAISKGLACEATPQAAMQMISLLEQTQMEIDAEVKALQPKEQQAARGYVDALRERVAALPRRDVPAPRPQPVVAPQVRFAAPAVPQQFPMPRNPVVFQQVVRQNHVEVEWHGTWWPAEVVQINGARYYIHRRFPQGVIR